jgi:hypothetical protein
MMAASAIYFDSSLDPKLHTKDAVHISAVRSQLEQERSSAGLAP